MASEMVAFKRYGRTMTPGSGSTARAPVVVAVGRAIHAV